MSCIPEVGICVPNCHVWSHLEDISIEDCVNKRKIGTNSILENTVNRIT